MKRFLFAGLLFLMPLNANALPENPENLNKLEKDIKIHPYVNKYLKKIKL